MREGVLGTRQLPIPAASTTISLVPHARCGTNRSCADAMDGYANAEQLATVVQRLTGMGGRQPIPLPQLPALLDRHPVLEHPLWPVLKTWMAMAGAHHLWLREGCQADWVHWRG